MHKTGTGGLSKQPKILEIADVLLTTVRESVILHASEIIISDFQRKVNAYLKFNDTGGMKMCDFCNKHTCPPGCPNYTESASARCRSCGCLLLEGDGYYRMNGSLYCEECVETATLEDLVRICDSEPDELLSQLGMRHGFFDPGIEPYE